MNDIVGSLEQRRADMDLCCGFWAEEEPMKDMSFGIFRFGV